VLELLRCLSLLRHDCEVQLAATGALLVTVSKHVGDGEFGKEHALGCASILANAGHMRLLVDCVAVFPEHTVLQVYLYQLLQHGIEHIMVCSQQWTNNDDESLLEDLVGNVTQSAALQPQETALIAAASSLLAQFGHRLPATVMRFMDVTSFPEQTPTLNQLVNSSASLGPPEVSFKNRSNVGATHTGTVVYR
jgi:hypothetical protein